MTIQEILALIGIKLPDNNQKKITAKDVRDSFALIGTKVESISTGYKDYLKITDPKPTVKGLYRLIELGNYTNLIPAVDENGNTITISAVDGKLNEAYFNGTVWTKSTVTLPGKVATTFDPNNDLDGQGGKQINSWLVNDVEGGESDDVKKVNEEIGEFYKKLGIDLNGGNSDGLQAGLYNIKGNSTGFADATKYLTKANIRLSAAGKFKFCIGRYDGSKFIVRWESEEKTGVVGWNNFDFTSEKLKINSGEMAAVVCLPSTTASIYFGDPGAVGNRFFQYSTTAGNGAGLGNLGSFYCLWFELADIKEVVLSSDAVFNLSKSVATIVEEFSSQNGYSGAAITKGEPNVSTDSDSGEGYAINKIDLLTSYLLEKIEVKTITAGTYKIAVGFFDQYQKFIEKKIITKSLTAGLNTITFDKIILEKGDYVGFKNPGKLPVNSTPAEANMWSSNGYLSPLTQVAGKSLPIKLFLKEYIQSPIATKAELAGANTQIVGFQQNFIHEGKKVSLIYNADGTTSWQFNQGYDSILVIGNSLAIHPITTYWWGLYGMAASKKENDYAHLILSAMQVYKPATVMKVINLAAWENDPIGYNKSLLDPDLVGRKFIPIRLGENASYNNQFGTHFGELVDYIISKAPTAKLSIGGVFWTEPNKDAAMKSVAEARNIPFVEMQDLNISANRSAIGNQVMGDDGQLHTITDNGVASHPGDLGHQAIAQRFMASIGL